ncbi:MAG: flagellar basal body L-ring protein FlgH [Oleispira sp.]
MKTVKCLIPARMLLAAIVVVASGCTSVPLEKDVYPNDPEYAPVPSSSLQAAPSINGSLYKSNYSLSLFSDQQATQVGDIITVIFDEQYNSSKSAETKSQKDSSNNATPTSILNTVPGWKNLGLDIDLDHKRSFKGKGDADRSNSLSGTISVTVSDILPSGVLQIRGEKWLTLSEGDEYIRIIGLIRPQDITPQNTVMSSKVADARIKFGGRGNLNNATKEGWFGRMTNSPWWPF